MNLKSTLLYVMTSAQVSAGDGRIYSFLTEQPPPLLQTPVSNNGAGSVSAPAYDWMEFVRRMFTNVTTVSNSLVSGGSAGSIAIGFAGGTTGSGIAGMYQGVPFAISAAGTLSGSPTSAGASTTSTQIRKILVTISMGTVPSSTSGNFALATGTVNFVYGSAWTTSSLACTSGSQAISYFDNVPLPVPSAGEIPMGWINCPNSFNASSMLVNSCLMTDWRVLQGVNLSAMMTTVIQP